MTTNEFQSPNPYTPTVVDSEAGQETAAPIFSGVAHAAFFSALTMIGCGATVLAVKIIETMYSEGGLQNERTIESIFLEQLRLFVVLTMLSAFSSFAYYGGSRRINSLLCLFAVFLAGILGKVVMTWLGIILVRRANMTNPPIYLSEFLCYLGSYLMMSFVLINIANRSRGGSR